MWQTLADTWQAIVVWGLSVVAAVASNHDKLTAIRKPDAAPPAPDRVAVGDPADPGPAAGASPAAERPDGRKRLIGRVLVGCGVVFATLQLVKTEVEYRQKDALHAVLGEPQVGEGSGGATDDSGYAYVVDDDRPFVYRMRLQRAGGSARYELDRTIWLWRAVGARRDTLDSDGVTDLEGAAVYRGALYLVTSHSNNKKGERKLNEKKGGPKWPRERLLKVSLEPGTLGQVLASQDGLRDSILPVFRRSHPAFGRARLADSARLDDGDQLYNVMEIEGLAIDRAGFLYLGFRAPLANGRYALVLRTPVDRVFAASPAATAGAAPVSSRDLCPYVLAFADPDRGTGITSMEYDPLGDAIYLVTNSTHRLTAGTPRLWRWRPGPSNGVQQPDLVLPEVYRDQRNGPGVPVKPEALLLPRQDSARAYMFLDGAGVGGQIAPPVPRKTAPAAPIAAGCQS